MFMKASILFLETFIIVSCVTLNSSYSQVQHDPSYLSKQYTLERLSRINPTSSTIPGIPLSGTSIVGNSFLKENFSYTILNLKNKEVTLPIYTKYDLIRNEFFLVRDSGFNVLNGAHVDSFTWLDSISHEEENFNNLSNYKQIEDKKLTGFVNVLVSGKLSLLKYNEALLLDPNYSIALNVGRDDFKFTKSERYFYSDDGILIELPTPKKILQIFKDDSGRMKRFIELNNLDLTKEDHIIELIHYYNLKFNPEIQFK